MSKKLSIELAEKIYRTLKTSSVPLKASDIARNLNVKRAIVNRALYGKLSNVVSQDEDFYWEVVKPFSLNNNHFIDALEYSPSNDKYDTPVVELNSIIDVVYLSGPAKGKEVKFNLVKTTIGYASKNTPVRLSSPIGAALFEQPAGEIVEYKINGDKAAVMIKSISTPMSKPKSTEGTTAVPKPTYQKRPLKVYENETHFLVEICASQKHRASDIPKRRWNRHISAWIYPKTIELYDALKNEFQRDAEVFEIGKPAELKPELEDFKNTLQKVTEKKIEQNRVAKENFNQQFSNLIDKIDSLTKQVERIEDSNDTVQDLFLEQIAHAKKEVADEKGNNEHVTESDETLEQTLILIAFEASGHDESFKKHLSQHQPITKPERFITRTHHLLSDELAKIAGLSGSNNLRFSELINYLQEQELLSTDRTKNVPSTLRTLNHHRNQVAHSYQMDEQELKSRSISYLMGIALIWDEVASEPV